MRFKDILNNQKEVAYVKDLRQNLVIEIEERIKMPVMRNL